MFRTLSVVAVLAAGGWSGYWWIGASAAEQGIENWLADRRADGWVAESADVSVAGFPNRFDSRIEALNLADPGEGWAWQAPEFQIMALSYDPRNVILAFPGTHRVATPEGAWDISGEPLRASISLNLDQSVNQLIGEAESLLIVSEDGTLAAERMVVGTEAQEAANIQRLGLDATNIAMSGLWRDLIDPAGLLPEIAQAARVDAVATFTMAPGLPSLTEAAPALDALDVNDFEVLWGELSLRARGNLVADERGYAEGELTIRARNWQQMIEVAQAGGLIDRDTAEALTFGLNIVAMMDGDQSSLSTDIAFEDGRARIGPVVFGEAPRLR